MNCNENGTTEFHFLDNTSSPSSDLLMQLSNVEISSSPIINNFCSESDSFVSESDFEIDKEQNINACECKCNCLDNRSFPAILSNTKGNIKIETPDSISQIDEDLESLTNDDSDIIQHEILQKTHSPSKLHCRYFRNSQSKCLESSSLNPEEEDVMNSSDRRFIASDTDDECRNDISFYRREDLSREKEYYRKILPQNNMSISIDLYSSQYTTQESSISSQSQSKD